MRTWAKELESYTHDYVRRGGKKNRLKQVSLIVNFLEFTDAQEGLTSLHRLGKRHIINFWKAHREMPEKSAYDHWLGFCQLWSWLGKSEKPPRPHKMIIEDSTSDDVGQQTAICFTEFSSAIKSAREAKGMPALKLANLSGCDPIIIDEIESGQYGSVSISVIQGILKVLNINLIIKNAGLEASTNS
ncbi:helix-turn-helix domain-containing protein [Methylomicrobium sp. Wu6]|uniref:helix-turn-helix domain-containing protein n=1 Tax=Methylomicrobium sp. Wu6 TaxID=3107928 RepID=UPI002DD64D21|nr:helix-turn-helix domain-containing protein [Methylomicrobium sp. Wu6]MEC4749873.1 helix-turn-helix domain-containing protein [Methylomicrobium sp. Wu6]